MRADKCTLSDTELIAMCNKWVDLLCKSGGKAWTLRVPADFNYDPDMIFIELIKRFERKNQPQPADIFNLEDAD